MILLVWVYYSSQILLFGAEFTQVYANAQGSRIVPAQEAIVTDPAKAKGEAPSQPDAEKPDRGRDRGERDRGETGEVRPIGPVGLGPSQALQVSNKELGTVGMSVLLVGLAAVKVWRNRLGQPRTSQ